MPTLGTDDERTYSSGFDDDTPDPRAPEKYARYASLELSSTQSQHQR